MRPLRVGTRGSKLALAQTDSVMKALWERFPGLTMEKVIIKTRGDVITDSPLRAVMGKGFFVKEIEAALLNGDIDFAVHSLKDIPIDLPDGLTLVALCHRSEPRDAFVIPGKEGTDDWETVIASLPSGSRIGTSSLRRQAQLKHLRPDWQFPELRGNVDTRLRKLDEGRYDAIVVAAAGLLRLGLEGRIACLLPEQICCPAAGQGVLAVEARRDDEEVLSILKTVDEPNVRIEVTAERAAIEELEAGCHAAVGALAQVQDKNLTLTVVVAETDGKGIWRHRLHRPLSGDYLERIALAEEMGRRAAQALREQGATVRAKMKREGEKTED